MDTMTAAQVVSRASNLGYALIETEIKGVPVWQWRYRDDDGGPSYRELKFALNYMADVVRREAVFA